ncbi:hypothetical protein CYLTODRAFT_457549 [Cylindrobasidium torrendii FP15055 ss-10]|uniref:Uncharacterized protein n=1 Tax=Cylindrobasidium torrendii FP15055 ss-10 TaxID=1314674 RepID=A0A0D7B0S0_9AGAR|nr:hypothetical protein CYLTODRAFT_457549 [Cylindrobasidium torrendii FP15055 ss-10]
MTTISAPLPRPSHRTRQTNHRDFASSTSLRVSVKREPSDMQLKLEESPDLPNSDDEDEMEVDPDVQECGWRHPNEMRMLDVESWTQTEIMQQLIIHAFSLPGRSPKRTYFAHATLSNGSTTVIPQAYRVPLMFAAHFMWESARVVIKAGEWADFKQKILHVGRVCSKFLAMAADEAENGGMGRSWRCKELDRLLVRYRLGWLITDDASLEEFHQTFGENEYRKDPVKKSQTNWSKLATKGHKGFQLTDAQVEMGYSAAEYMRDIWEVDGSWEITSKPRNGSTSAYQYFEVFKATGQWGKDTAHVAPVESRMEQPGEKSSATAAREAKERQKEKEKERAKELELERELERKEKEWELEREKERQKQREREREKEAELEKDKEKEKEKEKQAPAAKKPRPKDSVKPAQRNGAARGKAPATAPPRAPPSAASTSTAAPRTAQPKASTSSIPLKPAVASRPALVISSVPAASSSSMMPPYDYTQRQPAPYPHQLAQVYTNGAPATPPPPQTTVGGTGTMKTSIPTIMDALETFKKQSGRIAALEKELDEVRRAVARRDAKDLRVGWTNGDVKGKGKAVDDSDPPAATSSGGWWRSNMGHLLQDGDGDVIMDDGPGVSTPRGRRKAGRIERSESSMSSG